MPSRAQERELPSHKEHHLACAKRREQEARLVQRLVRERELRGNEGKWKGIAGREEWEELTSCLPSGEASCGEKRPCGVLAELGWSSGMPPRLLEADEFGR